jgi:hypothetical protein
MDKSGVNVTMAMFDAAVNYLCHNGDIIAREILLSANDFI